MFSSNVTSDPAACQFCVSFSTINKEQNDFLCKCVNKNTAGRYFKRTNDVVRLRWCQRPVSYKIIW